MVDNRESQTPLTLRTERERMSEKKKSTIARNVMKNLSRGGMKSIPVLGSLLEQLIYGTLDEQAAKKETEKLHLALSEIADKHQGQDFASGDVVSELKRIGFSRGDCGRDR